MTRRYPIAPLIEAMAPLSANQALEALGVSGTTQKLYRAEGVTEKVADRLAVKAGFHPFEIWPDMVDHVIEDAAPKARPDRPLVDVVCHECGTVFPTANSRRRYCSESCRDRAADRRRGGAAARRARYHAKKARAAL